MKSMLVVAWSLTLGWCELATAKGWIVEGPTMSACIKKDKQQKTIDENLTAPLAAMATGESFAIDFAQTAFRRVATTADENGALVTSLCSGRVSFAFDRRYRLESFALTLDEVTFGSSSSPDDYVQLEVRGFVSSEEGNESFSSLWPEAMYPIDFKGPAPYELTHTESSSLCGERLTLRIDQIEAQVRRAAGRDAPNSIGVPQLVFHFLPCQD